MIAEWEHLRKVACALLFVCIAVPAHSAQRIVTLAPHLAELVCAVGACDQLVGVVKYTDYPAQAAALPMVGDAVNLNLEQLVALKPDLVLAWEGGTSVQTIARVKKLGIPVEAVAVRRVRDIGNALYRVGQLTGTTTAASFASSMFYRRLEQIRNLHWKKSKLKVMYQIETDPVYTVSSRSPIHEAIDICGGINVFAGLQGIAPTVGLESVIAANPDAVVFAEQDDVARIRAFWARWPQTKVQQRSSLYPVNANLLARQSPRLLDGVEQLCEKLDDARRQMVTNSKAGSRS